MKILLDAGPPMYLGFLIHVCLYFVIIITKIGTRPHAQDNLETLSNSSYRTARSSTISNYEEAVGDLV